MTDTRKYVLSEYPYFAVNAPATSCLFCNHCTDVFWDFTNGIYMLMCDLNTDTESGCKGKCERFEEEQE